jgi:hypothetical protein
MGIVVVRDAGGVASALTLAHEKAHGVAVEQVDMESYRRQPPLQQWGHRSMTGYDDLAPSIKAAGDGLAMSEVAADIGSWEIRLQTGMVPQKPGYVLSSVVVAGGVRRIADEFGVTPLEVADKMLLGSWSTDRTIVDLARTAMGRQSADVFLGLTVTNDMARATRIAEAFDLEDAVDDLRRIQAGEPVDFFDWYRDIYIY